MTEPKLPGGPGRALTYTDTAGLAPQSLPQPLRMERMADLEKRVGLKKSQLWQLARDGQFPQGVKVGRATLFVSAEVDAWLRERIAAGRTGGAL